MIRCIRFQEQTASDIDQSVWTSLSSTTGSLPFDPPEDQ